MTSVRFILAIALAASTPAAMATDSPLKIYISADMEGTVGAVTGDQLGPSGFEYQRYREFMTAEVNACIEAAREAGINAAIAGHFGVPVIMVSGDDAVIRETREMLGDVEGAAVKWALGFHSARTLTPDAAYKVIRQKTRAAVNRIDDFKPFVLNKPVELQVSLKHYQPVELLSYLSIVERIDSHTIRFTGRDMPEVSGFLQFMLDYQVSLQP